MSTALGTQDAIVQALLADAQAVQLVGTGVYIGRAPTGARLPYYVLGEVIEDDFSQFAQVGFTDVHTLHSFSADMSRMEALTMHAIVFRVLDRKKLVPALRSRVSLINLLDDQDGQAVHAVTRVEFIAR